MAHTSDAVHDDFFQASQYFLGVAGMAMMRRVLTRPSEGRPRLDEIRRIVASLDEFPNDLRVEVVEYEVEDGYARWAPSYDGPNPLIEAEEPIVHEMLGRLEPGRAVDAGCGTGRHAGHLAALGFDTTGVDRTSAMLDVARSRFPAVDFRVGRMESLPAEDASVDVVTCALALCHVADLGAALAEFARVIRPGGTVVVSDPHPTMAHLGGAAVFRDQSADPADGLVIPFVTNLPHPLHAYVNAAVTAGLEVVECREEAMPAAGMAANPAFTVLPDAVNQAFGGLPFLVVWRFRRPTN